MIGPDWKQNLRAEFRPVMIPKAVLGAVFAFGFFWGFLAFGAALSTEADYRGGVVEQGEE